MHPPLAGLLFTREGGLLQISLIPAQMFSNHCSSDINYLAVCILNVSSCLPLQTVMLTTSKSLKNQTQFLQIFQKYFHFWSHKTKFITYEDNIKGDKSVNIFGTRVTNQKYTPPPSPKRELLKFAESSFLSNQEFILSSNIKTLNIPSTQNII